MQRALSVFYSYAHADEVLRQQLEKHLALLHRQGIVDEWHDRKISPASEWKDTINDYLESADVILLLISSDFLSSDYCFEMEMKRALERHNATEAQVLPVILRPCDWDSAPFGRLQALPRDGKPITTWNNHDEAFTDVARGLRALAVGPPKSENATTDSENEQTVQPVASDRRSRVFAATCCIVLLSGFGLASLPWPGAVQKENPSASPVEIAVTLAPSAPLEDDGKFPPDRHVRYKQTEDHTGIHIDYAMKYLERHEAGGPIKGVVGPPFLWDFPFLSLKSVNNSSETEMLSKVLVQVVESEAVNIPLLYVHEDSINDLIIGNAGWGEVVDPTVEFSISGEDAAAEGKRHPITLESFTGQAKVDLSELVPDELLDEGRVAIVGTIEYGASANRRQVRFTTFVSLELRAGHPQPPSHVYDVQLKAGEGGINHEVPISQVLKPGSTDHFALRIASDRTAHYRLRVAVESVGGKQIGCGEVYVSIFVPRGQAGSNQE